jgi:hypothetical protein
MYLPTEKSSLPNAFVPTADFFIIMKYRHYLHLDWGGMTDHQ